VSCLAGRAPEVAWSVDDSDLLSGICSTLVLTVGAMDRMAYL
jgi:hypothetical protein